MFKLIFSRIRNRKKASLSLLIAFIIIFSIVPFSIQSAVETKTLVTSTLEQHARGSFDLLIRPKGERSEVEGVLGVVEENYIGDGKGGISLEEWQGIQQDEDIEIAAPVAALGYFSGNQTSVGLPLLPYPARLTWQFATSDGLNEYLIEDKKSIVYFEGKENEYVDYYAPSDTIFGFMGARLPRNYYQLIAIDPESEEAITGVDYSDLLKEIEKDSEEGKILTNLLDFRGNPPVIPILQNSDLNISLSLHLSVERLDIDATEYKEKYGLQADQPFVFHDPATEEDFVSTLLKEPVLASETIQIKLGDVQSPFNGQYVQLKEDFSLKTVNGGPLSNDTGKYYRTSKIQYEMEGDTLTIPIMDDTSPPAYRMVEEQGSSYFEDDSVPFMLWQMGSYSVQDKKSQLASSPLGIYGNEPIVTDNGVKMTSTISPGSFITTGAAGLTTMEAARLIKGEQPIDAIRIRVRGIDQYDPAAKQKIERLATKYVNQGYEVDIVAGSSYKGLAMDVEKVGRVIAPWTTLGIAEQITEGINALTIVIISLFILFSFVWLGARLVFEYFGAEDEKRTLEQLGWQRNQIRKLYFYEQLVILGSSACFTLLLFFLVKVSLFMYAVFVGLWIVLGVFTIIVYRFIPIIFRKKSKPKRSGALYYYAKFIIPTALVLFFSIILITVQTTSLLNYLLETKSSRLGEFTISLTIQLQVALMVVTVGLTLLSVNEAILTMIHQRRAEFEMYSLIGWTKRMILKHFGKEVFQWSFVPVVGGAIVSMCLLIFFNNSIWTAAIVCMLLAFIVEVAIILLIKNKKYSLR